MTNPTTQLERERSGPRQGPAIIGAELAGEGARVRVDYHVHTEYSYDCDTPLAEVLLRAKEAQLGILCITDHDTIEGALALRERKPDSVEVVIGCEFTTDDGSQIIGLGLERPISRTGVSELFDEIKSQGGLILVPHPYRRGSGLLRSELRRPATFIEDALERIDLIESYNGRDSYDNNVRSMRLSETHDLPAVVGSDAHTAAEIGSAFVEYAAGDVRHGVSPRGLYYPTLVQRRENALKRRLMECYHRYEHRFPPQVGSTYRRTRRAIGLDGAPRSASGPVLQRSFPRSSSAPER